MITCTLRGQIGNQCFQIATVIAQALKAGTSYALPERSGKRDQFPNYFPSLPKMKEWTGEVFNSVPYVEKQFGVYNEIPVNPDLHLKGYFQSEKYFKDYREQILEVFDFPKIDFFYSDVVAVHVRRGDYLRFAYKYNLTTIEYLLQAINWFIDQDESFRFLFFSDDLNWCKANFNGPKYSYCEVADPKWALAAIGACGHGIIGPSTFGWWGNWIAKNNDLDRVVIAPKQWFNKSYGKLRGDDIVCENWMKI